MSEYLFHSKASGHGSLVHFYGEYFLFPKLEIRLALSTLQVDQLVGTLRVSYYQKFSHSLYLWNSRSIILRLAWMETKRQIKVAL